MARTSTIGFISKTKLDELSRQRDRLIEKYQTLVDESQAAVGTERLRILRDGLSDFGGLNPNRPTVLHPDLPNLEALVASQSCSDDLLQFWENELRSVVDRGRRRAETVYVFGALLGEWDDAADTERIAEEDAAHQRLLSDVCSPSDEAPMEILDAILANFAEHRQAIQRAISNRMAESEHGATGGWYSLKDNPHVPSDVRQEASRFSSDTVLENQFNDALSVATRDPSTWNWPEEGIASRATWTRNKWRLYPDLSFVEYALTDCCSEQWTRAIDDNFSSIALIITRQGRINQLRDLNAPEVIYQNEIRMLKKAQDAANLGWYEEIDPWTGRPTLDGDNIGGIMSFRAGKQAELRDSGARGYYDEAVNPMVQLVHAELQVLLAAYPDQPIHVAKLDIRNYFTEVTHDILKRMMSGLGMTRDGLDFLQRFMNVPWLVNGQPQPAQRGVPMEQQMSHWLCETLLRLLERHVHENSCVRIIRQIDDICLLAPDASEITKAWNAIVGFLADVGLSVNESKCGCVTINGEQSIQLADSTPFWGMLQLNADTTWSIHDSSFESFLVSTRQQIESRNSVFSKVLSYNEHLKFLTTSVGLAMDLGEHHRTAANTACVRFENCLFGDHGITEVIMRSISERYTEHAVDLPEGWLAWPITAGGLSLRLLSIIRGQYQLAFDERRKKRKTVPEEQPDDWQWKSQPWTEFYEDHLVALEPAKCRDSARMNRLVESFIRRGKSLSGGKQEGLSEYWRWVLSIHGPVILDRFGTFEFLLSDLVPLQLIHEKLLQRGAISSVGGGDGSKAEAQFSGDDDE